MDFIIAHAETYWLVIVAKNTVKRVGQNLIGTM